MYLNGFKLSEAALKHRIPSQWRIEQNHKYSCDAPDGDELRKIIGYLNAGATIDDVCYIFNISPFIAKKIKLNRYVVNEIPNYKSPTLDEARDIKLHAETENDLDIIRIEYNLSEQTLDKIIKGIYKPPKKNKTKKNNEDSDDNEDSEEE